MVGSILEVDCLASSLGEGYMGRINHALDGRACLHWADVYSSAGLKKNDFPDVSIEAAENFCRNPDGRAGGPWCMVKPDEVGQCSVPYCGELTLIVAGDTVVDLLCNVQNISHANYSRRA